MLRSMGEAGVGFVCLVLGEMGGVVVAGLGLVDTVIGAPGLANFSGLEIPRPPALRGS